MTNVQKARLLHRLLRTEIPEFLGYLNELTETVLNEQESLIANWNDPHVSAELWFELAADVQAKMARYPEKLYQKGKVFADELFDGCTARFTAYALNQYVVMQRHRDPHFKPAVELFFK
ncbi:hypothetical protein GCM10023313_11940 [Mucilaginibacter defluvii]|uniref:Uncharacterized protein n=2 Tax=Mucilaginibacter defluvii TaxID=1196019 RepID=A0ABP9FV41_9SPHI